MHIVSCDLLSLVPPCNNAFHSALQVIYINNHNDWLAAALTNSYCVRTVFVIITRKLLRYRSIRKSGC